MFDTGEIKDVKDGYARNYLIPKGLCVVADKKNLAIWKEKEKIIKKKEKRIESNAEQIAEQISNTTLKIYAKCGLQGRLYGSITSMDVGKELEKVIKVKIDKRKILLTDNIKTIGNFTATIKLTQNVSSLLKIEVLKKETEN